METPIGSGPYRIGSVVFGKDITYVREPDYWARDLPVRRGTGNFDRIIVKIYKDSTARLVGRPKRKSKKHTNELIFSLTSGEIILKADQLNKE